MLPNELWFEIVAFAALIDPTYISLGILAQSCRTLHAMCQPAIHAHMLGEITKSGMPTGIEVLEAQGSRVGGRKLWLTARHFNEMKLWLGRNETKKTILSIRYMIHRSSYIESINVQGQAPDIRVLNAILNSSVRCSHSFGLNGVFAYDRMPGDTGNEDGPFTFSQIRTSTPTEVRKPNLHGRSLASRSTDRRMLVIRRKPRASQTPSTTPVAKDLPRREDYVAQLRAPNYLIQFPLLPLRLKTLDLTTPSLFSASLYPWTLFTLNQAPLSRLNIDVKLSILFWAHFLPVLTMPSLRDLTIGRAPLIPFSDLLKFLSRHPTLESLDLAQDSPLGPSSFPSMPQSQAFLPFLTVLRAPPPYILPFLWHFQHGHFPRLHTFNLKTALGRVPHAQTAREYREHMLFPTLEYLSQLSEGRAFCLQLTSWSLTGLLEWLVSPGLEAGGGLAARQISVAHQVYVVLSNDQLPASDLVHDAIAWVLKLDQDRDGSSPDVKARKAFSPLKLEHPQSSNVETDQLIYLLGVVCPGTNIVSFKNACGSVISNWQQAVVPNSPL